MIAALSFIVFALLWLAIAGLGYLEGRLIADLERRRGRGSFYQGL